jgi:hypothetical protein
MERVIPHARRPAEPQERPEPPPRVGSLPRVKPKPQTKPVPIYSVFGPLLLKAPPIRHRNGPAVAGLLTFELVLGATVCLLARFKIDQFKKKESMVPGKLLFANMRRKPTKKTSTKLLRYLGAQKYKAALAAWEWPIKGDIEFDVSRRALFRMAGLPRTVRNLDRLPEALKRLTQPTNKTLPPILVDYKMTDDKVLLTVDVRFAPPAGPGFQFYRMPWPLPASGPIVLALYLFAFGTDQRAGRGRIEYGRLYKLLGIPKRDARRALDRAVIAVNKHLERLNNKGLLDKEKLPTKIDLSPSPAGRFVRIELSGAKYAAPVAKAAGCDDKYLEARAAELEEAAAEDAA